MDPRPWKCSSYRRGSERCHCNGPWFHFTFSTFSTVSESLLESLSLSHRSLIHAILIDSCHPHAILITVDSARLLQFMALILGKPKQFFDQSPGSILDLDGNIWSSCWMVHGTQFLFTILFTSTTSITSITSIYHFHRFSHIFQHIFHPCHALASIGIPLVDASHQGSLTSLQWSQWNFWTGELRTIWPYLKWITCFRS